MHHRALTWLLNDDPGRRLVHDDRAIAPLVATVSTSIPAPIVPSVRTSIVAAVVTTNLDPRALRFDGGARESDAREREHEERAKDGHESKVRSEARQ